MNSFRSTPERLFETVVQNARVGMLSLSADGTIQYANPFIEQVFGYAPATLVGRSFETLVPESRTRIREAGFEAYLESVTDGGSRPRLRLSGTHRNGRELPLHLTFGKVDADGEYTVLVQEVANDEPPESQLTAVTPAVQALTAADTRSEICELVVEAARTVLPQSIALTKLYDVADGRLKPGASSPEARALSDGGRLFPADRSCPWTVFATQERTVVPDVSTHEATDGDETRLRSAMVFPLGSHGVFVAGGTEPHAFDDTDVDRAAILVAAAQSALDRVALADERRSQQREFDELTTEFDRSRRLNSLTRALTAEVTGATTRDGICQRVCETLVASDPYQFVWIGTRDPTRGRIVPKASAGGGSQFDDLTLTLEEDPSDHGIVSRALADRHPHVDNAIHRDPPFKPWREAAIRRGYRSSIAVPIAHQDTLYGVLSLYASDTDVFDAVEQTVLQELGGLIGYALNATDRREASVSQQSVELVFSIHDPGESLFSMPADIGGTVTVESIKERRDGRATLFFTQSGAETTDVLSWTHEQPPITDVRLLVDRDSERLFECVLGRTTVWSQLLQRGASVRSAEATPDSTRIGIRIPRTANTRSFDALLRDHFGPVDLVARREYDEPVLTVEQFDAAYKNRLTERQREVLQTAYHAGYFEWPRAITARELADVLGVSQPTVSRHLRSCQLKFLSMIYD